MVFPFRAQAVPLGYDGVSFQVGSVEIARYNAGRNFHRPFVFPVIGPSGRLVTRMTHPHDPHGHRHHYSLWIAHMDVNGLDFWSDETNNRQAHRRFLEFEDGVEGARMVCEIDWVTGDGERLLRELRTISVIFPVGFPPPDRSPHPELFWSLDISCELDAIDRAVRLGKTPFGLLGVRVAKSMTVKDGGGRVINSEGKTNEKEAFCSMRNKEKRGD